MFTDGVDNLINAFHDFFQEEPSDADSVKIISALLEDEIPYFVAEALGHRAQSKWNGPGGNRALEILGNLVGGTDASRIAMSLDQKKLAEEDGLYIDDTTIIVWELEKCLNVAAQTL